MCTGNRSSQWTKELTGSDNTLPPTNRLELGHDGIRPGSPPNRRIWAFVRCVPASSIQRPASSARLPNGQRLLDAAHVIRPDFRGLIHGQTSVEQEMPAVNQEEYYCSRGT